MWGLIDAVAGKWAVEVTFEPNPDAPTCDLKAALNDVTITWDGKQLTIDEIETSPKGKKTQWREAYSSITSTSFLQVGASGEIGGPFQKVMTLRGTRIYH